MAASPSAAPRAEIEASTLLPPDPGLEPWEQDLLAIALSLSRSGEPVVPFALNGTRGHFINSAAGAQQVLVERRSRYVSIPLPLGAISRALTEPGAALLRQRLAQSPRIPSPPLNGLVAAALDTLLDRLAAFATAEHPVDLLPLFKAVLLGLMTRTLFGVTLAPDKSDAAAAAKTTMERYRAYPLPPGALAEGTPARARQQAAFEIETDYSREILARAGCDDLLPPSTEPIPPFDEEPHPGAAVQPVTLVSRVLMNSYNGPAVALGWLAWILGQHPAVQARVAAEADAAFRAGSFACDDVTSLPYTRMVVQETLRLYPPAWLLARSATTDDIVAGVRIEGNSLVAVSPFTLHRDSRYWSEPERFLPERFDPQVTSEREAGSYLPFGLGPGMCPASAFAMRELQYALARLAHRFELVAPLNACVRPWGLISLHPIPGVMLLLRERNAVA